MQFSPISLPPLDKLPLVSVLIPSYNYGSYLPDALESIVSQTYTRWEVIVCDDASDDESRDVISGYELRDPRIILVKHEINRGMGAALNTAFGKCSGQIVCLLDADDAYAQDKLDRVVERFRLEPDVGLIVHPLTVVDDQGAQIQQIPFMTDFEYGWIAEKVIRRGGRWRDMPTSALAFRREVADLSFPIPEQSFKGFADGYLFTLMPLLTNVSAITQSLGRYRVHGKNMLATVGAGPQKLEAEAKTMQQQADSVNIRLRELGCDCDSISVSDNLSYRHKMFLSHLIKGSSPVESASELWTVSCMTVSDDLLGRKQKVTTVIVLTVALVLPSNLRRRWLNQAYGYSSLRYWIQRARVRLNQIRAQSGPGFTTAANGENQE